MKKILAILFLIFTAFFAQAQYKDWTDAEIHLKDGAILIGKARLIMIDANLAYSFGSKEYLRYINFKIKQRKSIKYSPEEIEKIVFNLDYKLKGRRVKRQATYILIIISKNKKKIKYGFAELHIDGAVKLVKRTVSNSSNNRGSIYKESLLVRNNEEAIVFNYVELKSFKKRASEYFSNCPSLVLKIEDKKYTRNDLEGLVNYYNDNCAK